MAKKEEMIFVRGKWEIASVETNATTGKRQWVRRDTSYICDEGSETERVPMPAKPTAKDVPNLDDGMTTQELMAFWNRHRHGSKACRVELFGRTGDGTVKAARDLANYASNKATAMQCRERGDIQAALMYEGICERIYSGLPDFARW